MIPKILLLFFLQSAICSLFSQEKYDSTYIKTLSESFHVRSFLSRKYANLTISEGGRKPINYEPNSDITLGLGITVRSFTLDIAYGFDFLNTEEEKGETTFLDLQTNVYKRKFLVDAFVQRYSGLFLSNTNSLTTNFSEEFYLRPDVQVSLFGISALKIFNDRKFSYAAPFVQNEIQEKSAGTFLLGARAFASRIHSDSVLIPFFIADSLYGDLATFKEARAFQFGPSTGYAYSLIIKKRFFIIASLNLAFMIGPVRYTKLNEVEEKAWQINPVLGARLGVGYNSPKWFLGITLLQEGTTVKGVENIGEAAIDGGNIQLNYVRRYTIGKKFADLLDKLSR